MNMETRTLDQMYIIKHYHTQAHKHCIDLISGLVKIDPYLINENLFMGSIIHTYSQESGFTLVELMIVIAIIGILMAAGIPSYNKYIKKAHYSEIIQAATPYKIQIEECLQIYNGIEHCNITRNHIINKKLIHTISISEDGTITVTPNNKYGITENETYVLTPKVTTHGVHWEKSGGGVSNGYA